MCGNTNEPEDTGGGPGKSSLFFLTSIHALESVYPARGMNCLAKHHNLRGVLRANDSP